MKTKLEIKESVLQEPTEKRKSLLREGFIVGDDSRVLLHLHSRLSNEPLNLSQLHYETKISYAWVLLLVHKLDRLGLVSLNREGRIVWISLTQDGKIVAQSLLFVKSFFEKKSDAK